jgi:simple sugar transport system substrate-binding protein
MQRITSLLGVAPAAILLSVFSSASLAHAAGETFYVIAHAGPGDPYWALVSQGADEAAKKLGVKVVFSAPDHPGDIARQVALLDAAIAAKPAGIATTIPDAKPFEKSVQRAVRNGIPIVTIDTREAKRDAKALPYSAYIGADGFAAGKKVGERALATIPLKSTDTVVVLNHEPGVSGLELRTRGITEVMNKAGIKIETLDITANPSKAMVILESYLKAKPGTRAIFTLGSLGFVPAGKVLQEKKLMGKIALTGFDIDPAGLELIRKGIMNFTIDAQPHTQAFVAITQLYLAARYQSTPTDLDTGAAFLDASNVERFSKLIASGYK